MKEKIAYTLNEKLSKKEIRAYKFEQNQKHAKPYLLVTSSKFWFRFFGQKPHLYKLHLFLLRTYKIRKGGPELIDIMFDKINAIHEQNFELAASLRDTELQMQKSFMQSHNIIIHDYRYATVKNGKINFGIFYIKKRSPISNQT
jgi:hypothetical protein